MAQLASLTQEVAACANQASQCLQETISKDLATRLLTTVAACMINNVAPTVEESINAFIKMARSATSDGAVDLAASVAELQQQVNEMKELMATASFATATPKAAGGLEKAIRDEAYGRVLHYVSARMASEG